MNQASSETGESCMRLYHLRDQASVLEQCIRRSDNGFRILDSGTMEALQSRYKQILIQIAGLERSLGRYA